MFFCDHIIVCITIQPLAAIQINLATDRHMKPRRSMGFDHRVNIRTCPPLKVEVMCHVPISVRSKFCMYEGRSKSFEPDYLLLDFWAKNVTGLSNGLLLVFFEKNLVVCLFSLQDIMY